MAPSGVLTEVTTPLPTDRPEPPLAPQLCHQPQPVARGPDVFKLVESAQARRRAITGAHLVSLARAGAVFENGILVEREEQAA